MVVEAAGEEVAGGLQLQDGEQAWVSGDEAGDAAFAGDGQPVVEDVAGVQGGDLVAAQSCVGGEQEHESLLGGGGLGQCGAEDLVGGGAGSASGDLDGQEGLGGVVWPLVGGG